jgi:hypothetical protein
MNMLNGLSKVKEPIMAVNNEPDQLRTYQEFILIDRHQEGCESGHSLKGSESGLSVCIRRIFENHKEVLRKDLIEQDKAKEPYKVKLQEYLQKNIQMNARIAKIKEEDIPKQREMIDFLKEDVRNLKNNPEVQVGDKVSKAGFYIGLIILAFLTLYLFIFYSSASYSAFFKEFTLNSIGVADSIFDAQALSKSYNDGITELLLILTIPFVFLGLGYLIHKFQEQESWTKYLKILFLIIVTFIFDSILAYEITEKIYNIKAENSFEDMPPYTILMAFQSVNFWLIIFAGFLVYLIWGFVFDFVMEAYAKLDKLGILIRSKEEEIKGHAEKIKALEVEIDEQNHKIGDNTTEAEKIKTILDHRDIIRPRELEHSIYQFLNGWLEYLSYAKRPDADHKSAHVLVDEFVALNVKSMTI